MSLGEIIIFLLFEAWGQYELVRYGFFSFPLASFTTVALLYVSFSILELVHIIIFSTGYMPPLKLSVLIAGFCCTTIMNAYCSDVNKNCSTYFY